MKTYLEKSNCFIISVLNVVKDGKTDGKLREHKRKVDCVQLLSEETDENGCKTGKIEQFYVSRENLFSIMENIKQIESEIVFTEIDELPF